MKNQEDLMGWKRLRCPSHLFLKLGHLLNNIKIAN